MEIETNNIRYDILVKKIFAYLLFRAENFNSKNLQDLARSRSYDESFDYIKEIRSLSDTIRSVIWLLVMIIFIILMVVLLLDWGMPLEVGTLFILIVWILWFILWVKDFIRRIKISSQYKQMEKYFFLKSALMDSLKLLKWQIIIDIKNQGIDPINVHLIGKMIADIGEVYSYIHWPMKDFSQLRNAIETNTIELLDKVVLAEKNGIIEFAQEFYNLLQIWLENHKIELKKEVDNLAQNQNEAVILATDRLKLYMGSAQFIQP